MLGPQAPRPSDLCPIGERQPLAGRILNVAMEGIVLLLVFLTPWAFGCVHPSFEFLLDASLALLVVLWATKIVLTGCHPVDFCPVALCMAGLLLLGLWQIAPLSRPVLGWVSPATAARYDALLPAAQEKLPTGTLANDPSETGFTISVDRGATREEVVRLLAMLAAFLLVRQNLTSPGRLKRLCLVAALNGTLLTLYALVQFWTMKRGTIYWSIPTVGWAYGPFINHDHGACYLNLCFGLALGLFLIESRRAQARAGRNWWLEPGVLWSALPLTILLVGVAFSLSRGGLLAFFGAAGLCLAIQFLLGMRGRLTGSLLAIVCLSFVFLSWFGVGPIMERLNIALEHGEPGRLRAWSRVLPLVAEFPLWGTGYGTFASVEMTRRTDAIDSGFVFNHAHNEYVEAIVEGGLPRFLLTLGIVFLVGRAAVRIIRREPNSPIADLTLGCLFSVSALVLQSFVEFAVHVPAISLLATAICAHLSGAEAADRTASRRVSVKGADAPPIAVAAASGSTRVVAALVALGVAFVLFADGWKAYRVDLLQSASRSRAVPTSERILLLEKATRLTPDDASLHLDLAEAHLSAVAEQKQRIVGLLVAREAAEIVLGLAQAQSTHSAVPCLTNSFVAIEMRDQRLQSEAGDYGPHVTSALRELVQARNSNPLLSAPHLQLATHIHELAALEADSPLVYLDRAKLTAPGEPRLWYLCGLRELSLVEPRRARSDWRRSLELSSKHLKEILDVCKPLFSPEIIRTEVLADNPDQLLFAALHLFPEQEQEAERRPFLEQAQAYLERQPAAKSAEALHTEAVILASLNHSDRSLTAYQRALGQEPQRIEWRWEFAKLLHKQARLADARLELRTILQDQPQHAEARELWRAIEREIAEKKQP
jgi:O-antigen ligase/tetratricopeptide (TPR) repeat protein